MEAEQRMILGRYVERNARCFPHHPAIVFEGRTLTHLEFAKRAYRLANALAARGIGPRERIAVLSQNCPEYLEAFGAADTAGYILCGVNYRLALPEQAEILKDCEPAVLIYEPQYADRVAKLRTPKMLCIALGSEYEALLASAADARPAHRPKPSDTCYLVYTSGTTGRPKGVMHSQHGMLEMTRGISAAHSAQQCDRMLIVMPFYHIGGRIEQLTYHWVGATILLHRAFDPAAVLENLQNATSAHLAPVMIQALLDLGVQGYDFSSLHTVCYASSPMSVAQLKRAIAEFGNIFMQVYGMTEHGLGSVLHKHQHKLDGDDADIRRLASAGQAFPEVDARVVRPDGTDCGSGEIGELWLRSATMMQGYWRNPEATKAALGDGWFRTGDVGYFDDEQYLFIADRKKDMICSGGENIYSREVEEALAAHPAVAEVAVIGVPDAKWGEAVKAFVALKPGARADEAELIEHCRSLIASYKKPRSVQFMSALPRTNSTNKIDKKALREPFWAGHERRVVT
jgi:acyl-CoA synthetase (AMP-forming)/AMP-acid ligase II